MTEGEWLVLQERHGAVRLGIAKAIVEAGGDSEAMAIEVPAGLDLAKVDCSDVSAVVAAIPVEIRTCTQKADVERARLAAEAAAAEPELP
jgi:hypothetical protein